jgi:hypothetical protein
LHWHLTAGRGAQQCCAPTRERIMGMESNGAAGLPACKTRRRPWPSK